MSLDIYHYHPETLEYLGSSLADESPLEPGVYLIPASATTLEPPVFLEGHRRVYVPADNSWTYEAIQTPVPEEPTNG